LNDALQILEFVVLFGFLVLASAGWGSLCCQAAKLPLAFGCMLGFAILACLAYMTFFVFVWDTGIGRVAVCVVGLVSLGVTVQQIVRGGLGKNLGQTDVWFPVLLLFLYTAASLLVLLFHGNDPRHALSPGLPEDNVLPQILAERLWSGASVHPFYGDWLSSDRPPLQAAVYLLCLPLVWLGFNADDIYGIVSTLCQTLWLPAVYLLARQLRWTAYAVKFMLVWFAGSGFFLLHSIFAWPKLFSAAFFLSGLTVLLRCAEKLPEKKTGALLMLGLLWGLALLAHGGVLFSLLAVPLFPSAWRLLKANPGSIMGALVIFVVVNLPWAAYQKFYDPPGNRLVKMHLAGVIEVDARGTWETVRDSYGSLTFAQWFQNRFGNVKASLLWDDPRRTGDFRSVAGWQRYLADQVFFRLTGVFGLLNLGFLVLAVEAWRTKKNEDPSNGRWRELLLMNVGCYLGWIILIYRPDQAIVHQGSFAMIILFMMIALGGLARLPVGTGIALLVGQWVLFAFDDLYCFYLPVIVNPMWVIHQVLYWFLILLFVGSVWRWMPRDLPE